MSLDISPLTFHPQRPCKKKEEHIGREYILRQAFARLNTDDVQSFVIIGLSKIGKTSFINQIKNPSVVKQFIKPIEKAEKYYFLLFDCEKHIKELHSEEDFFKIFYKKIDKLFDITYLDNMMSLDQITQWLLKYDLRLIIVLENFNLVITNPNFNVIFYDGLRSWFSTNVSIGCIITSPIELLRLAVPTELSGSPFFNIFNAFTLAPLTLTEATMLLDNRLPKELDGHEIEIFDIIKHVGLNPYELQLAGSSWVKNFRKTGEMEFKKSLIFIYNDLIPYYNKLYSSLTDRQIKDIRSIISNENITSIDRNLISNGWVAKDKKKIIARQMKKYFCYRLKINFNEKNRTIKRIISFFNKLLYSK